MSTKNNNSTNTTLSESTSKISPTKRRLIIALIVVVLGAVIGFLVWQLVACRGQHDKDLLANQGLQAQVDDLKKQLANTKKGQDKTSSNGTQTNECAFAEPSQMLKNTIADAISSKNTAALEGYMASAVDVVFAASEKGGPVTPAQAVIDLNYLSGATAPWDFNLAAATLDSYKAGYYRPYFEGAVYVGKSANEYVVAFGFDECTKINRIFVSGSADLLL